MRAQEGLGLPEGFRERLSGATGQVILLDYDRTLASLQPDRNTAARANVVMPALRALSTNPATTVAVLSVRPVAETLERLAAGKPDELDRIQLLGDNGWERLRNGTFHQYPVPPHAAELLRRAENQASDAAWSGLVEARRTALVLHTRRLVAGPERRIHFECKRLWSQLARRGELHCEETEEGLELRAAGRDTSTVLRELLADNPPGTLLLYIGDEGMDEIAFQQMCASGLLLRFGAGICGSCPRPRPVSNIEGARWLDRLCAALNPVLRGVPLEERSP